MSLFLSHLDWIDAQQERMRRLLIDWAAINSGSENLAGLARMAAALSEAFASLGGDLKPVPLPSFQRIDSAGRMVAVPSGQALSIVKRPQAGLRVLLAIHMDTVYPAQSPFQKAEMIGADTLQGPGVADAKGGLAVMLLALEALERSPLAERIGWEIFINPDEELGSPASAAWLAQAAGRNHLGLLFEPSLDESGTFAGARHGSGNFAAVIHGRAAHAGRQFEQGRNALVAAAELALGLETLSKPAGLTVNIARIEGGGPLNVVPDLAILRWNIRLSQIEQVAPTMQWLQEMIKRVNQRDGLSAELHGDFHAPPKALTPPMQRLMDHVAACGRELGLAVNWQPTGGVCDGNKLAAAGLPNVDTLGVRGGAIHSPQEFMCLASLAERARLTALLLMRLAGGELPWNSPPPSSR